MASDKNMETAERIVSDHEARLASGKYAGRTPAIDLAADIAAALTAKDVSAVRIRDDKHVRDAIVNAIIGRGKFRGWAEDVADDAIYELTKGEERGGA